MNLITTESDPDPPEILKQLIWILLASEPFWRTLPGAGALFGEEFLDCVLAEVWNYGTDT